MDHERTPMTADDQTPTPDDYRRAAAFCLHRLRRDVEGVNAILAEASELDRTSALILCVLNLCLYAPGSWLPTVEGARELQRIAIGDTDE